MLRSTSVPTRAERPAAPYTTFRCLQHETGEERRGSMQQPGAKSRPTDEGLTGAAPAQRAAKRQVRAMADADDVDAGTRQRVREMFRGYKANAFNDTADVTVPQLQVLLNDPVREEYDRSQSSNQPHGPRPTLARWVGASEEEVKSVVARGDTTYCTLPQ